MRRGPPARGCGNALSSPPEDGPSAVLRFDLRPSRSQASRLSSALHRADSCQAHHEPTSLLRADCPPPSWRLPPGWRTSCARGGRSAAREAGKILEFGARRRTPRRTSCRPALAGQIVPRPWPAWPPPGPPSPGLASRPAAHAVPFKLILVALTASIDRHARLRAIPRRRDDNFPVLEFHLISVTTLGLRFVLTGIALRRGGVPFFS